MARVLSTATVLGLLAATAVAFAITEHQKLVRSPIYATRITYPVFSPGSKAKPAAHVKFRLRTRERLTVWIENAKGENVATLLPSRTEARGAKLDLLWDGFQSNGLIDADGAYRPVVKLERSHRTIVLPNSIRIDTKPPVITTKHRVYAVISPDGDRHHDAFRVHYRINEPAHAILAVRGTQVERTHGEKQTGELTWYGTVKKRHVGPGQYVLTVSAQDVAGNLAKPFPFGIVDVRFVVLARKRVVVRPGGHFAIRVSTDAPQVDWRLHGASGVQSRGTLHFRAPRKAGVYFLYVTAAGHAARCAVVVG